VSFYARHVLPRLIRCACGSALIAQRRAELVPLARGRVLEIGCGGGLNFRFYDPNLVSEVAGIDPSPPLLAMAARAAARTGVPIAVQQGEAERLPFESGTFDTAVLTFTLCSVRDPGLALAEISRVLAPGGQLLFCEHGLAPDAGVRRWQARIEPAWKRLAGGCHLTRPIGRLIAGAGLHTVQGGCGYMPGAPRFAGWLEWGAAAASVAVQDVSAGPMKPGGRTTQDQSHNHRAGVRPAQGMPNVRL